MGITEKVEVGTSGLAQANWAAIPVYSYHREAGLDIRMA